MDVAGILAIFIGGFALGALSSHLFRGDRRDQTLSKRLDEVHAEFANYQESVDQHFAKTADLINDLTDSYVEVHQHLARGAQTLSKRNQQLYKQKREALEDQSDRFDEVEPKLQQANEELEEELAEIIDRMEPPKDYAPKGKSNEKGTLSEDYGLKATESTS